MQKFAEFEKSLKRLKKSESTRKQQQEQEATEAERLKTKIKKKASSANKENQNDNALVAAIRARNEKGFNTMMTSLEAKYSKMDKEDDSIAFETSPSSGRGKKKQRKK